MFRMIFVFVCFSVSDTGGSEEKFRFLPIGVDRNPGYQSRCSATKPQETRGSQGPVQTRTFHESNLIRIKADPNDLDRLNRFKRRSYLQLNYVQKAKNAHFGQTGYKIRYNNLCTRFGT